MPEYRGDDDAPLCASLVTTPNGLNRNDFELAFHHSFALLVAHECAPHQSRACYNTEIIVLPKAYVVDETIWYFFSAASAYFKNEASAELGRA